MPTETATQLGSDVDPISGIEWIDSAGPVFDDHDCRRDTERLTVARGAGPFRARDFAIRRCRVCGLGLTSPVPTAETAHLLYETRESMDFQPDNSGLARVLKDWAARRDVRAYCGRNDPRGTILDCGCGDGSFVRAVQRTFPGSTAVGADFHEEPPRGLDRGSYTSYANLAEYRGRCSVVIARHVIEHSYDPVSLLREWGTLLTPDGFLAIEVPSIDAMGMKVFGRYWDGNYVPYHPLHFDRASLRKALEAAGLRVVLEGRSEMPKVGRSLQNVFGWSYGPGLFLAGVALHPMQVAVARLTNTSTCLRVWAKRALSRTWNARVDAADSTVGEDA